MNKKIIILGGEGNGGVVAACIIDMHKRYNNHEFEVMGFLNDMLSKDDMINGFPVLGKTKDYKEYLFADNIYFMFAIHPVGHGSLRVKLFNELAIPTEKLAIIIHPSAFIGYNATIEPGVMIMANSYVGTSAHIHQCVLLMANTVVGHNTEIGAFCHLSVASVTSSYVKVGTASDIALNATVLEKKIIGKFAVIGAGAMITKDVHDNEVVIGNPQKVLRLASDKIRYK